MKEITPTEALLKIAGEFNTHAKICPLCGKTGSQLCTEGVEIISQFQRELSRPEAA